MLLLRGGLTHTTLHYLQEINKELDYNKNMKTYQMSFKKKDGTVRNMKFVRPNVDVADSVFFEKNVQGVKVNSLKEGFERVWDVEVQGFRVVNHNEVTTPIEQIGETVYDAETNSFLFI